MSLFLNKAPLFREDTEKGMSKALERQADEYDAWKRGEITQAELGLRTAGNLADATVGTTMGQVIDPFMSAFPALGAVSEPITKPMRAGFDYLSENYPRLSRNIEAGLSATDLGILGSGAKQVINASRKMDELTGFGSDRGMLLSSLDNYIKDYYGRSELEQITLSPAGRQQLEQMNALAKEYSDLNKKKDLSPGEAERKQGLSAEMEDLKVSIAETMGLQGASAPRTIFEKAIERPLEAYRKKDLGVLVDFESTKESRAVAGRVQSLVNFATTGVKDIIRDFFSPEARALFREQGLSRSARDIIASHTILAKTAATKQGREVLSKIGELTVEYRNLNKPGNKLTKRHGEIKEEIQQLASTLTNRGLPKGVAEAIYQMHIGAQAGRQGGLNGGLLEIARESFLESYNAYRSGTLSSWFTKHNRAESDLFDVSMSDDVSATLERNIINAHRDSLGETGVPALVVMKRPTGAAGKHEFDVKSTKSAGAPAAKIKRAFDSLGGPAKNQGELIDALMQQGLTITGKGAEGKVYFSGSTTGSAIVEGGIHVSGYVLPDGTAALIMSDVHDFFEKAKPAKVVAEAVLPNSLLAVSPPVFTNFITKGAITNKAPKVKDQKPVDVASSLEQIATAKPSPAALQAEQQRQRGMLTMGAGGVSAGLKQQEDEQQGP